MAHIPGSLETGCSPPGREQRGSFSQPVFLRVLRVKMPKKRGPDRKPTPPQQSTAEALISPPPNLLELRLKLHPVGDQLRKQPRSFLKKHAGDLPSGFYPHTPSCRSSETGSVLTCPRVGAERSS